MPNPSPRRLSVPQRASSYPPADAERCAAHFAAVGLPTRISEIPGAPLDVATLMAGIGQDKKVRRGSLTFILTRGIGQAFIANDVDPAAVEAFLTEELTR